MKSAVLIITFLSLFCLSGIAQNPAQTVPSFDFLKLDNTVFTDKHLTKDKSLFFIFFDVECDHCHKAIAYISQHYKKFVKAAIYLVTINDVAQINVVMNKYGNNLVNMKNVTLLRDTKNEFIQKFGPRKYPSLFLYSSKKKLILYDDNEQNLAKFAEQINASSK